MNEIQSNAQVKLWTSHFIKVMFLSFFISVCTNIQSSTLPLFAQHVGGDNMTAGLMFGVFTITALVFRPFTGNLIDNNGRRNILIIGTAIFTIISFLYGFVNIVLALIILRFIHGIGFSGYSTASSTVIADIIPRTRLMEGMGYFGISYSLGTAIGPAIGLYLSQNLGYTVTYVTAGVFSAIALVFAFMTNYEKEKKAAVASDLPVESVPTIIEDNSKKKFVLLEKTAIKPAIIMFFTSVAVASIVSFLPAYALSKGIKDAGLFFTVYGLVLLVSRPFTGKISDRFGPNSVLLPGIMCMFATFTILIFIHSLPLLLVAGVLFGLGFGTVTPVLNAITIKVCPPDRRGRGNATLFSFVDAGYGVGSILWGFVANSFGLRTIFIAAAVNIIIATVLYVVLLWKRCATINDELNEPAIEA